ncbi:MAG TPA: N-acetylglucosamine-6-phosphate deacetylase, partial [Blastocatellia bacterium]|nr:N-acetylglucosamine-6-phosphate deacetylase [Blastocatellia bacterium]
VDVLDADRDALATLSSFLAREGTTGYFATLVPAPQDRLKRALVEISDYCRRQDETAGARLLGVHFEGPFVNASRCGALNTAHFLTYDGDPHSIETYSSAGGVTNRLITLAPEITGGISLVRDLVKAGVRVFIGHSRADLATLDQAAEAGARHITHFPNALDPLHHRNPGTVGWGLVRKDVTLDCIADLHHVHPLMLELMYQAKGPDSLALISDAIKPTGLGDGDFEVWGEQIRVQHGRTSLVKDGEKQTIAGSVITMRHAVTNIIGLGVQPHEAARMASLIPSRLAGVEGEFGSIETGKRADLVALDDNFDIRFTMVGGRMLRGD